MLLDTTTRKLQIVLGGAKTTNNCPVVVGFTELNATTFTPGVQAANTNGTTNVDICNAPGSNLQRKIHFVSIYNKDTTNTTLTVQINDNGTIYEVIRVIITPGTTLCFSDHQGWYLTGANSPGRLLSVSVITNPTTTYTTPFNCKRIFVRAQGPGGGGGGGTGGGNASVGSGGSAGGYCEKWYDVTQNTAYTVSIGTGGGTGAAGSGATTFTHPDSSLSAGAGTAGATMTIGTTVLSQAPGAVPTTTGGDINAVGEAGGASTRGSGTLGCSGKGGSSVFGGGGLAVNAQGNGNNGTGFGSGGSGGCTLNGGAATNGGSGTNGVIVIWEYTG